MRRWLLAALVLRLVAARTQLHFHHPDEWFQTVEFGNYLAFGFASQTNEFVLHMRNLTFPAMLAAPMRLAHWLSPGDPAARMLAVKLLTGLLDLLPLLAIGRMMRAEGWSPAWRRAAWLILLLCPFLVAESVRPSQEHLSAIAFWCALGLLARAPGKPPGRGGALAAGVALALTGAFRYPSLLLPAGAGLALAVRRPPRLGWILAGAGAGLAAGGLGDWLVFGRPYESFWMYFQYNVLTGLSKTLFGAQGPYVYLEYFKGAFGRAYLPLGLAGLVLVPVGLARGLRRVEPWAWGAAAYLLGHLLIGHKESRFMSPLLLLTAWAGLQGARALQTRYSGAPWASRLPGLARSAPARAALGLWVAAALLLTARELWGETWRALPNYLRVARLAREHAPVCAAITVNRPVGFILPWTDPMRAPEPAIGFFPAPAHRDSSPHLRSTPLIWIAHGPDCAAPGARVLVQPQRTEEFWRATAGCELLPTGPLLFAPPSWRDAIVARNWVAAPWYLCPSSVFPLFPRQETRQVLSGRMARLPELPPPGISGEELLRRGWNGLDPRDPAVFSDSTMGDLQ